MKTIKEITEQLQSAKEPEPWMAELSEDSRAGVKAALNRWQRQYDKNELIKNAHITKIAFDRSFVRSEEELVAGVDEAGRGPLAGPVVTAAVILPADTRELIGLDDSKAITKQNRERFAEIIKRIAIDYSVHIQPATTIDAMNIYAATRDSMEQAVNELTVSPHFVIVDAMSLTISCPTASVIKGDAKSLVVAAASILAKTERDAIMDDLHNEFPMYHFINNAGYGTAKHLEALEEFGPCEHHRRSFEPIKSMTSERRT
ncbi:ribonuclease HII [Sporosarcina siberiensis]|uniref:Ribonuclease HII n=1 Tax=Sporosarcina siberiensis TaxID=1365606 RepID=A0ABW4SIP5_9BACL